MSDFQEPTEQLRLAQRTPPSHRGHVMRQDWRDLLFIHWRWDPEALQPRLPDELRVDTFDGSAWVGATPFFMRNVRPRWIPPLPFISNFMEMNLRTYVYDRHGRPGVWFFSLETDSLISVAGARAMLGLPYFAAEMRGSRPSDSAIDYQCRRRGKASATRFRYRAVGEEWEATPGSLEFFLIERYLLFAQRGHRLLSAQVHHKPYPLRSVDLSQWDSAALAWIGLQARPDSYDHLIYATGVDVKVYPPQQT